MLQASTQLEAFDGIDEPCQHGIYTTPPVLGASVQEVLDTLAVHVEQVVQAQQVPVVLGGEHTLTFGAVRGLTNILGHIGVIHFDAHADLRDRYEGNCWSHACVMRRVLDLDVTLLQLGVRALSKEEAAFRKNFGIAARDAPVLQGDTEAFTLPEHFPEKVYVSFDVDALDPSLMPATGTPEPGGLDWYTVDRLLRGIAEQRQIAGFDMVELAPITGLHACEFTAARLTYNLMGMIARSRAQT